MSETSIPTDRSYSSDHEWVMIEPGGALPETPVRVGITAVAVDALGEVVYLELPEVGSHVESGRACGEVESTKTVSDIVPPVSGRVTEVNSALVEDPAAICSDPYGAGWLFSVLPTSAGLLLSPDEYATLARGLS